jgi:Carboxypeptidase regulatory-like domain/TonB dependent receptor/TonB-dependent Receptor Plug Domain
MSLRKLNLPAAPFAVFAVIVSIAVLAMPVNAQLAGANLSGVVSDESGAAVAGAKVTIKNLATGDVREVGTNTDGLYSAPNLAPATYDVTVTATGFGPVTQKGLVLNVGGQQSLDIKMKVGQLAQEVEVNASATTVETTTSAVSATVEQKTVVELPLNGRDWTQLATLQPGVTSVRAQASNASTANRGNRGFGNQLSDSGHRPNENTYRIDGININDYSNGSPGSVLGAALGVDAIQEFNVVTTNYTAEYGRTSGAVINAVTRSGTNDIHGSAYFFDRDKIFDAKPFFASEKAPFRRIQFGGSAGAPIIKDKTFIFGDYEGVRQSKSQSANVNVPSANARSGMFANGDVITPDADITRLLALYPLPSNAVTNGDVATFGTSGLQTIVENYFTIRADHKFSEKDSLNGSYFFDKAPQNLPDSLNNVVHQVFTKRQMVGITESHIFSPALANIARLGFNRVVGLVNSPVKAINPAASDPNLGVSAGLFAPLINVAGLTSAGGLGNPSFFGHHYNSYQFYDDVFLTRGKHSFKAGFAFERLQYNVLSKLNPNGRFGRYSSVENFIANAPTTIALLDPSIRKEVGSRDSLFGGYFQDDWRVTSNLTLNLGLRYEMLTLPTEAHNGFGVINQLFAPAVPGGCAALIAPNNTPGCTIPVNTMWKTNPTNHNFAPRVGFSWDPFRNGKTAFRGGFGIFDILPLPYVYSIGDSLSVPFAKQLSGHGTYHSGFDPNSLGNTALSRYIEQNPHRSYALNYNVNIEREITSKISAMIGYVGSHSVHEAFTTDDSNQVAPPDVRLVNGVLTWPLPVGSGPVLNGNVGDIRPIFFDGSSKYNSFQSQIQVKGLRGFQGQASFTLGKCFDDGSGAQLGDPFLTSVPSLIFFDKKQRHGRCDFDVHKNLSINTLYNFATPQSDSAIVKHLAGGWQLGMIMTASSGTPFTVVLPNDALGQNSTDPWSFPDRLSGCSPYVGDFRAAGMVYLNSACFAPLTVTAAGPVVGTNGRNSLFGPGLVDFDFTVLKDTRITEKLRVQFRAEFFNIFNHANFQAPNIDAGTSTIGFGANPIPVVLSQTATEGRDIQFGLKLIF